MRKKDQDILATNSTKDRWEMSKHSLKTDV